MTTTKSLVSLFDQAYADATQKIEILDEHRNGTGYYNGLARAKLDFPAGTTLTFEDNGRLGLVFVGEKNNVVVFQRYTDANIFCIHYGDSGSRLESIELFDAILNADNRYEFAMNAEAERKAALGDALFKDVEQATPATKLADHLKKVLKWSAGIAAVGGVAYYAYTKIKSGDVENIAEEVTEAAQAAAGFFK